MDDYITLSGIILCIVIVSYMLGRIDGWKSAKRIYGKDNPYVKDGAIE